jgi:hypothetical protein
LPIDHGGSLDSAEVWLQRRQPSDKATQLIFLVSSSGIAGAEAARFG